MILTQLASIYGGSPLHNLLIQEENFFLIVDHIILVNIEDLELCPLSKNKIA